MEAVEFAALYLQKQYSMVELFERSQLLTHMKRAIIINCSIILSHPGKSIKPFFIHKLLQINPQGALCMRTSLIGWHSLGILTDWGTCMLRLVTLPRVPSLFELGGMMVLMLKVLPMVLLLLMDGAFCDWNDAKWSAWLSDKSPFSITSPAFSSKVPMTNSDTAQRK